MHSVGVIIFTSEGRLGTNQFTLQMQSQYYVQLRVGISTEKPDFVKVAQSVLFQLEHFSTLFPRRWNSRLLTLLWLSGLENYLPLITESSKGHFIKYISLPFPPASINWIHGQEICINYRILYIYLLKVFLGVIRLLWWLLWLSAIKIIIYMECYARLCMETMK